MNLISRLLIVTCCLSLSAAAEVASPATDSMPPGRADMYWRARQLRAQVRQIHLDALDARLTLEINIRRTRAEGKAYLLYRVGRKGRWNRTGIDDPMVNISSLCDGKHILQLMAVEDGIVYQTPPTEVEFSIHRNEDVVTEGLAGLLASEDSELENLAVEFLSHHLDLYLECLRDRLKGHDRASFLLDAARTRAKYGGRHNPAETPKIDYLVHHEGGDEAWDFSQHPSLNPWYTKRNLQKDLSQLAVRFLYFDGCRLWFGHDAGLGCLDPNNGNLQMYGTVHGLPTPAAGGITRALDGDIYAGTSRHLTRYDEASDRFVRVRMERMQNLNISGMEVNGEGELWMVSTEYGGGVSCYDGDRWWHFGSGGFYGIARDPNGLVWTGADVEHSGVEWKGLSPVQILKEGAKPKSRGYERLFADYLGRLIVAQRLTRDVPLDPKWASWPEPNKKAAEEQKIDGRILFDFTNREIWIAEGKLLINDTRRCDPRIPPEERLEIPAPEIGSGSWNEICLVAKTQVYLGTKAGLHKFDGESWKPIQSRQAGQAEYVPSWPAWPVRSSWHDGALYKRISATKIEINKPFPGKKQPRGRFYEILKRNRDYFLIEVTEDGQVYEYKFQPPFYYYPHALFVDYDGHIWATGTHYVYFFDGKLIKTYTRRNTQHMPNDHIYSFAPDAHGNVWIGTEGSLCLFRDGFSVEPPKSIPGTIFAMVYDSVRDRLIVSSSWRGFYIRDAEGMWKHYRIPYHGHSNHDQMVRSVTIDKEGTLWLATNSGLVSFSQKERKWIKYGNEFTEGVVLGNDNRVYVQSSADYVLIDKRQTNGGK